MVLSEKTYEGSCLCGKDRYRAAGPLGKITSCHCTDCQKSHAAAFATYVALPRPRFSFARGEGELQTHRAETGTKRAFCKTCGSTLFSYTDDDPEMVYITAGTFDTRVDQKVDYHIFVRSKASWFDIQDGKPQHAAYPEVKS